MEITIRHVVVLPQALEMLLVRVAEAMVRGAVPAPHTAPGAGQKQDGPDGAVGIAEAPGAAGVSSLLVAPTTAAAGLLRQNAPAAAVTVRPKLGAWRTEERRLLLEADWPRGRDVREIRAQMEGMAGPPVPVQPYVVAQWASDLGLRRPGAEARKWRTPERRAVLVRDWPAGVTREEIAARMAALPGAAVPADRLKQWAADLDLARPEWFLSAIRKGVRQGGRRKAGAEEQDTTAGVADAAASERPPTEAGGIPPVKAVEEDEGQDTGARNVPSVPPSPQPIDGPPNTGGEPPAPPESPAVAPVRPVAAAAPPRPPPLPAPAENGKVYATYRELRAWAGFYGIAYDGSNMDRLNRVREAKGLPPMVQVEAAA